VERMSAQDASFLDIEDGNNPMHVGSVTVFEGPPPSYGDLVRAIAAKLPLVPRYRQKVRFVPSGLGRPVWVDDPHFQILYHVRHTALPRPGGNEQLRNLAGRVFAQLLDRNKPLWEIWLVEGLEGDRWAMCSKVHHCMVDGVAATDLLTVLLDRSPEVEPPSTSSPWSPPAEPRGRRLLACAMVDTVTQTAELVRELPGFARATLTIRIPVRDALNLMLSARFWIQPTVSAMNGPIGPHRRWSWAEASLDDIKAIRHALGGTVNDVVLATITAGFRVLLLSRGERVDGKVVRTLVPVSVRTEAQRGVYNNRVSGVFPGLPVGIADPLERLRLIREQMDGLKQSKQALAGDAIGRLSGYAPPMLLAMGARLATGFRQSAVQTVTTNVPGPPYPIYAAGRKMLYSYPYVPIAGSVRITIAIFSYCGGMYYGITGDYDGAPDIEILRKGIEDGVAELHTLAVASSHDGRARRRTAQPARGNGASGRQRESARRRAAAAPQMQTSSDH
jgi:diacylglycerol O-acyltransferase